MSGSSKESRFTADDIRAILEYCPETGAFTWKPRQFVGSKYSGRWSARWAGKKAGTNSHGYRYVRINQQHFKCSRLAWLLMTGSWPIRVIDHIDGNRGDDKFSNLREATSSQNNANQRRRSDNKSGFKGVSRHQNGWIAFIRVNGKSKYLGLFRTPEKAHAAYCAAAAKFHGTFARAA